MKTKQTRQNRFLVTLSDIQKETLDNMMAMDMQHSRSVFISFLISEEWKRRTAKKSAGRPKKEVLEEEADSEEALYDHPDQFSDGNKGRKITKSELVAYYEMRGEVIPDEVLIKIRE